MTEMVVASTSKITNFIPQDMLNELMTLGDLLNRAHWRVGDIVNELAVLAMANHANFGRMEIYAAVADVVGKSARSIRSYASVSGFYPPDIRERYEVLPFSHFAFAMQYPGNKDGVPTWSYILEKSLDLFEKYGMPVSVDRLSGMFVKETEQLQIDSHFDELPEKQMYADNFHPMNVEERPEEDFSDIALNEPDGSMDLVRKDDRKIKVLSAIDNLLAPLPELLGTYLELGGRQDVAQEVAQIITRLRMVQEMLGEKSVYVSR